MNINPLLSEKEPFEWVCLVENFKIIFSIKNQLMTNLIKRTNKCMCLNLPQDGNSVLPHSPKSHEIHCIFFHSIIDELLYALFFSLLIFFFVPNIMRELIIEFFHPFNFNTHIDIKIYIPLCIVCMHV